MLIDKLLGDAVERLAQSTFFRQGRYTVDATAYRFHIFIEMGMTAELDLF